MTQTDFFEPGRKFSNFVGKAVFFLVFLLFFSLLATADVYKKIRKLDLECRAGNEEACAELAELARYDEDENVRVAAAANLKNKSLAQTIFASIAKHGQDAEARMAAVKKLTDQNLLENLANHAQDNSVRRAAARKLNGEDISDEVAENSESEEASDDEEAVADNEENSEEEEIKEVSKEVEPAEADETIIENKEVISEEDKEEGEEEVSKQVEPAEADETIAEKEEVISEEEEDEEEVSKEDEQTVPAAETPVVQRKKQVMSGKKVSMLIFELRAGSNTSALLGIGGAIMDYYKNKYDMPYYDKLRLELIRVSEEVIKESDEIDYISDEEQIGTQAKKSVPFDTFAKRTDLFAVLSIKTSLGVGFGWKKKLIMLTVWEITNASGHKVKIKTEAKSKTSQGVFPDVGNPELEPVWLDMARDNALQFLDKLAVVLQEDVNLK